MKCLKCDMPILEGQLYLVNFNGVYHNICPTIVSDRVIRARMEHQGVIHIKVGRTTDGLFFARNENGKDFIAGENAQTVLKDLAESMFPND